MKDKTVNKKKNKVNSIEGVDNHVRWQLLPIIFMMGILPLIMKMYDYDTNLAGFSWYSTEDQMTDFFNYYKHVFFQWGSGIMLVILIWQMAVENGWKTLKKQCIFIPLAIYGLMVLLSTVGSEYRWFCTNGTIGQFETVYVLLGYCLMVVYCSYFVRNEEDVTFLLKGWCICLIPMVLLGVSQICGHDFYGTALGQELILTPEAKAGGAQVQFTFERDRVYLSLFNPNYVGSFCELAFPIFMTLAFFIKSKKGKIISALLTIATLSFLIGASAKTAFVILPVLAVFLLLLFRKDVLEHKRICLTGGTGLILIAVAVIILNGGKFIGTLKSAFTFPQKSFALEEIETEKDDVKIVYGGNTLSVRSQLNDVGMMGFLLQDGEGKEIRGEVAEDESGESVFRVMDERFSGISLLPVQLGDFPGFSVRIDGEDWLFSNYTNYQGYFHYSPYGKFTKIETAPSIGLKGYEWFATNRGYIWSRTLPLLRKHILLGSGPDTFLMEFPQTDYIGRNRYHMGGLLSKPHNMYLQIAVQTGMVSLAAFLSFYGMYAVSSIRLYWKHASDSLLSRIGTAVCAATIGYMLVGVTTDSTINVAPLFWCLIGIGLAINRIIRNRC